MGRIKASKVNKVVKDASASKNTPSVSALVAKAQSLMGEMDFELARKFVDRILEMEPNHFEAREMLAIIEVEDGNIDAAQDLFISLVPPSSTARLPPSYSSFLYLAQLTSSDPRQALSYYQSAVDQLLILIKGKERTTNSTALDPQWKKETEVESEESLKRTTISALVAMVEMWMSSDLCMEPEAESTCDHLASLAIQSDPENIEALECLASVRLSQSRPEEAKQTVEKAWALLKDLDPDDARIPPLSTQISLTRRCLELSLFSQALILIQLILGLDDENIDAWYLQGWCFFLMAQQVKESGQKIEELDWTELAQDARDCLEQCRLFYAQGDNDDEELIQHVRELIGQLDALGIKASVPGEGEDEGDEPGEEDWSDEESDVEMG